MTSDRGQLFVIIELAVMELHQLQMALLVLDDRLLRLSKKVFFKSYATVFVRDKCCHVTLGLHLVEPKRIVLNSSKSRGPCGMVAVNWL